MAWTDYNTPQAFFGPGYSATKDRITLCTGTPASAVGTTFQGEADDDTLTFATAHGLSVGDVVRVTEGTTLPTGLAANTDYYVRSVISTTVVTLSATLGGALLNLTADGTADNTMQARGSTVGTTISCTVANIILFAAAHGLKVGDRIKATQVTTLPTGLTNGATYYVKTVPTTTTITVATTRNGATVAITVGGTSDNTIQALGPLDELTDAEAHPTTGDVRKLIYANMEGIFQKWLGIPVADRPANMNVTMAPAMDATTGRITKYYQISLVLEPTGLEVADE